jgi:O-antigen chain-terminating methyltransferase
MNFSQYNFNPFQFTPSEAILQDAHSRHVPFFKGCKRVIDLGAGRGLFLSELRKVGIAGIGIENHQESISRGTNQGLEYFKADIFEFYQSADGQAIARECDGVYCSFVIEHLDPAEVFELFRNIFAYSPENVRCRFITHNPADIDALGFCLYGDLTHKRLYVPIVLAEMARSQGFSRTAYKTFLGMKLGKKDTLRRIRDWFLLGKHKWHPNYTLDCWK